MKEIEECFAAVTDPKDESIIEDGIEGIPLDDSCSLLHAVNRNANQFNLNLRASGIAVRTHVLARDDLEKHGGN